MTVYIKARPANSLARGLTAVAALALALAALQPVASRAQGDPGDLEYSPVDITVQSRVFNSRTGQVFVDSEIHDDVPSDSTEAFSTLAQLSGAQFPTSTSLLRTPFASALMTAQRFVGVGASGIVFGRNDSLRAEATFDFSVTNVGQEGNTAFLEYQIPASEVSLLAGSGVWGQFANIRANASFVHLRADGTEISNGSVFDYEASIEKLKTRFGEPDEYLTQVSPDLRNDSGGGSEFRVGNVVFGIKFDEFEAERDLPFLEPGESLRMTYLMSAFVSTTVPEFGMQALIGDPFSLSLTGGEFAVSLRPNSGGPSPGVVPEPGTAVFLAAAGLMMAGLTRRRRVRLAQA